MSKEDELIAKLRSQASWGNEVAGLSGELIQHLRLELDMAKARERCLNWQPIETAPTDDRIDVLLYEGGEYKPVYIGFYAETKDRGGKKVYIFWDIGSEPWKREPTHWMPLPEPPNSRTGESIDGFIINNLVSSKALA